MMLMQLVWLFISPIFFSVVYRTKLAPRQVLDRLEEQGFRIVGTCGVGQTCVWTLSRNH